MNPQEKERNLEEEERSTETQEDINSLLSKQPTERNNTNIKESSFQGNVSLDSSELKEIVGLMKQLSLQYDEIEHHIKQVNEGRKEETEPFPVDLVVSFVKSTRISPSLIKLISSISEENKTLRRDIEEARKKEESVADKLHEVSSEKRMKKQETKYLEQTIKDLTKELKIQKEETVAQRKKLLETEAALSSQKAICKGLLKDKSSVNKELDIHEQETSLLKNMIDEKNQQIDHLSKQYEETKYDIQNLRRKLELSKIQSVRMQKRAELKERALAICNEEMDKMIKQLDRLSKMDIQKREKLEHLKILKKRLEHENKEYMGMQPKKMYQPSLKPQQKKISEEKEFHSDSEISNIQQSDAESIPISFEQALEHESLPESENNTERTTTSFREMQKKTEEMTRKFQELEDLLQEIKKGTDSDLNHVEERINTFANEHRRK
ncbi:hypothetical protein NEFER03_1242 [Nematocida sp. LUAm3]|nr:hypothetical protein NEFER03_1242 [Nematocida sp. LUAm3]KAI5175851.1 hypothetical protein NEFER02_1720 [Nematocida sp. LUAm2]KAI5178347.1 hypothetical protein NEFER01_1514 [Nematocida sp. LUAm1]